MACLFSWIEAHQGTAAWVQAVGSLLALVIAIWIPFRQSAVSRKQARFDKAESFKASVEIAKIALGLATRARREIFSGNGGSGYFHNEYDSSRFNRILDALDSVGLHTLPTPKSVIAFSDARIHFNSCWGWVSNASSEFGRERSISDYVAERFDDEYVLLLKDVNALISECDVVQHGHERWSNKIRRLTAKAD